MKPINAWDKGIVYTRGVPVITMLLGRVFAVLDDIKGEEPGGLFPLRR